MTKTNETLYLSKQKVDPSEQAFTVMDDSHLPFGDNEGWFVIIGSSHYIEIPQFQYAELFSYNPELHPQHAIEINLTTEETQVHEYTSKCNVGGEMCTVKSTVEIQPLSEFPVDDTFDMSYRFDEMAYTTIDINDDKQGYETYHTYPEYDLAVYTTTEFL